VKRLLITIGCLLSLSIAAHAEPAKTPAVPDAKPLSPLLQRQHRQQQPPLPC